MIRFIQTVIIRSIDGDEVRVPEGSLAVKDLDGWRFLSPRPLLTKKLPLTAPIQKYAIRLKQAALPLKTPEQEDRVIVFKRHGGAVYVSMHNARDVDLALSGFSSRSRSKISIRKGLEHRVNCVESTPVSTSSTINVIKSKVPELSGRVSKVCHVHQNVAYYGLQFQCHGTFDTIVANLQNVIARNKRFVRRVNWGLDNDKLTFQLWFRKIEQTKAEK